MPVATTISTSSHHHRRNRAHPSHHKPYAAYEDHSISTLSASSQAAETLIVGGSRQGRAEACENPAKERRLRAKGAMTSQTHRRTYSHSKTNAKKTSVKEPRVVVREVRRSDSEHRHHHRRSEKEGTREEERGHVYRAHGKSERRADGSRPSTRRRSTSNAREASKTRHERQRTSDRELQRRHSERRPYLNEEKKNIPLRREKRSIADHVPKSTRDRAPVTR